MDDNALLRIRNLYDNHADLLGQILLKQFLCEFAISIVTREFSIENENSQPWRIANFIANSQRRILIDEESRILLRIRIRVLISDGEFPKSMGKCEFAVKLFWGKICWIMSSSRSKNSLCCCEFAVQFSSWK